MHPTSLEVAKNRRGTNVRFVAVQGTAKIRHLIGTRLTTLNLVKLKIFGGVFVDNKNRKNSKKLSFEEIVLNEKKEKILKGKELLKIIKTDEDLNKFLNDLKGVSLNKVRKTFEYFYPNKKDFKKHHDAFYTDEIKIKCLNQELSYDDEMIKILIEQIKIYILEHANISMAESRERNRNKRERKRQLRQLRKLKVRQADITKEIDDVFNSTNFRSSSCRSRYKKACLRFGDWLTNNTGVKKVYNVKQEHLEGYILYIHDIGYTKASARTELYGILYLQKFIQFRNQTDKKTLLKLLGGLYE